MLDEELTDLIEGWGGWDDPGIRSIDHDVRAAQGAAGLAGGAGAAFAADAARPSGVQLVLDHTELAIQFE